MTWKNARAVFVTAFILPLGAMAQAGSSTTPSASMTLPTKIGVVSIQSVIGATNDGQKNFQALEEKFDPRKNELKLLSDEIDNLKKQLEVQGSKLNDEARANLGRQIDSKQKALSRAQEDAQSDFTEQQNEIVEKILQKLLPIIEGYATENGYSLVIDGSKPWPQWPVLWASPSVDITKAVVDIYNGQFGAPSLGPRSRGTTRPVQPEKAQQTTSPKP